MEKWKNIYGYTNLYQISNTGKVKSIQTGKILIPWDDKRGYLVIGLYKKGKEVRFKIHRLVATAFISNPKNKPQVTRYQNRIDN